MKHLRLLALAVFLCSCTVYISPVELPRLKGTWDGWFVFRNLHYRSMLIIHNESLPLKGNLVIYELPGDQPIVYPFENGEIDAFGHLFIRFYNGTILDLSLVWHYSEFKLDGMYFTEGKSGRIALLKAG